MSGSNRKTLTVIGCVCFAVPIAVQIMNFIQYRAVGGMLGALIYLLLVLALAFRSPLLLVAAGKADRAVDHLKRADHRMIFRNDHAPGGFCPTHFFVF